MIYYLISPNYINVVTFVSILFAFALTCFAIYMGKNILPRDGGRAYAINGSKSVGKPRGAGIIFILVFTITCDFRKSYIRDYYISDTGTCCHAFRIS